MEKKSTAPVIFLGLLGWLFIGGYFWLISQAGFVQILRPKISSGQIQIQAESDFESSPLGQYPLARRQSIEIDENISSFVTVKVSRKGGVEVNGKNRNAAYELHYGLNGESKGFSAMYPELADSSELNTDQAFKYAKNFFHSQGVDTASLVISEKTATLENGIQKYELTFTKPSLLSDSLLQRYEIKISGSTVTEFKFSLSLNDKKYRVSKFEEISDIVFEVAPVVVWMIIIVIMIWVFLKRVKHEEIEFKRARWIGLAVLLIMGFGITIGAWPDKLGMILAGIFGGLFMGVAALIVYALSESFARDTRPEKLALVDLLFRGRFRVKELGGALLMALFIGGCTAFYMGAAIFIVEKLPGGYIAVKSEDLWIFGSRLELAKGIAELITGAFFFTLVLLTFLASFLKSKIRRKFLFFTAMVLLLAVAGQFQHFLRPFYLHFFMVLPLSFLWVYWVAKHDLMTISLGMTAGYFLLNFYQLALLPEGFWSLPGILIILSPAFVTIAGIILLFTKKQITDFDNYVPEYVSRIAERERFLRELEIARRIQTRFLPQEEPQFAGLDIASICKPAMEVGGDYYDFIVDEGRYFSVVVGDVSGKGVSAAFYMTMTKGIIKTLAKRLKEPSKILSQLNEVFYENAPRNIFISVLYGIFDMENRTLTFARAGHNPLLVRKNEVSAMELLNPKGIAVGMEKGPLFSKIIEEQSVHVEPGDIFIFYTDGISEAMNTRGEEFGEDRLEALLRQNAGGSAKDILENIRNAVFGFTGSAPQHDDFTMVVVKVN
jgi:sigma-B regulation protein RsbU (phosphoserine phosphatase)